MTDKFHWHKAFGKSDVPSHIRPIGYIIWDYTNERGEQAFPGNEIIAQSTGLNKKTVERGLTFLRDAGWLFRVSTGSNSGRKAMNSVYRLSYPAGYSEQATLTTSVPLGEDGTGDTHDPNQGTPVSRTGDTHDPLNRSLSNQVTDPPLTGENEETDDLSYLYEQEINTDTGAAETYAEQWSAAEWRRREETRRVEAEARAERDREYEAKRAQSQAELEALFLTELKSIDWVSNNWAAFEKFCDDENVKLARRLSLAQRARDKSTSSPFGLFKSMIRNGTPGLPSSGRDTSCASPTSGHAWQE